MWCGVVWCGGVRALLRHALSLESGTKQFLMTFFNEGNGDHFFCWHQLQFFCVPLLVFPVLRRSIHFVLVLSSYQDKVQPDVFFCAVIVHCRSSEACLVIPIHQCHRTCKGFVFVTGKQHGQCSVFDPPPNYHARNAGWNSTSMGNPNTRTSSCAGVSGHSKEFER